MKEYIEREAARMAACELCDWHGSSFCAKDKCAHPIETIPAADVVEVVRCKDCKYADLTCDDGYPWCFRWMEESCGEDWYCADGKRKDDPCQSCAYAPPSSTDGKPCSFCDPDDPTTNCYMERSDDNADD